MSAKKAKVRQEDRAAAVDYLKKAEDNHNQMVIALKNSNYNAVGTLAIQCAVSSADAVCVYEKGIRSISQDHFDVCNIIRSITLPEAKEKSNLLRKIIAKKNLIQYERRNMHQNEAVEIANSTSRFYQWVSDYLRNK